MAVLSTAMVWTDCKPDTVLCTHFSGASIYVVVNLSPSIAHVSSSLDLNCEIVQTSHIYELSSVVQTIFFIFGI